MKNNKKNNKCNNNDKNNKNNILIFLINNFKYFLKMSFIKKFIITYIGCWFGFLSMVGLSKVIKFLFSFYSPQYSESAMKTIEYVATKKFEVVSSSISTHVGYNYLSVVLSYFINNSMSCIIIILAFVSVAYIYKRDIKNNLSTTEDFLWALILFYIIMVINPLTGFLGYDIDINYLPVLIPHGIFEFAGLTLSILIGIGLANRILPIEYMEYKKGAKDIFSKDIILKMVVVLMLIGVAAFLEPINWMAYQYATYHNINIVNVLINIYLNLIKILFSTLYYGG